MAPNRSFRFVMSTAIITTISATALLVILAMLTDNTDTSNKKAPPLIPLSAASSPSSQRKVDLKDAASLDENYGTEAAVECASGADDYLRDAAKYEFKWDDLSWLEPKFDKYRKSVTAPGVLTDLSDHISLQNGFGAFERIVLLCDYATQSKKVLQYRIETRNP